jgi:hypothetical protein
MPRRAPSTSALRRGDARLSLPRAQLYGRAKASSVTVDLVKSFDISVARALYVRSVQRCAGGVLAALRAVDVTADSSATCPSVTRHAGHLP